MREWGYIAVAEFIKVLGRESKTSEKFVKCSNSLLKRECRVTIFCWAVPKLEG